MAPWRRWVGLERTAQGLTGAEGGPQQWRAWAQEGLGEAGPPAAPGAGQRAGAGPTGAGAASPPRGRAHWGEGAGAGAGPQRGQGHRVGHPWEGVAPPHRALAPPGHLPRVAQGAGPVGEALLLLLLLRLRTRSWGVGPGEVVRHRWRWVGGPGEGGHPRWRGEGHARVGVVLLGAGAHPRAGVRGLRVGGLRVGEVQRWGRAQRTRGVGRWGEAGALQGEVVGEEPPLLTGAG